MKLPLLFAQKLEQKGMAEDSTRVTGMIRLVICLVSLRFPTRLADKSDDAEKLTYKSNRI